ncbi:phosphorylase [Rhizobium leguminosarum bv. trifolii]|uniref:Phosphorylase n=1 Tax=Rhizobium leguminosarum bv. trifolii TaxID=386 RepID=A0A3E1BG00_RHILT|nr:phosphorylase [Rhizobium leguminosarum]RFB90739.1 phosphorylase [Rhizobium leguminosarum bv. trifolii]RFB91112.1 phosphorylase [Rhizobium leguminosarum bv. trifolii]
MSESEIADVADGERESVIRAKAQQAVIEKKQAIFKKITSAVINAIPHEYASTKAVFGDYETIPIALGKEKVRYVTLTDTAGNDIYVALAGTTGAGIAQAAAATAQVKVMCPHVKTVILIGIAAGQPNMTDKEKDVRLGDIVVGDKLIQYDHIKRSDGVSELRGDNIMPADRNLIQAVDRLRSHQDRKDSWKIEKPWDKYIEAGCSAIRNAQRPPNSGDPKGKKRNYQKGLTYDRSDDHPYVHVGTIGSASILLKDAAFRDELNKKHGTIAYEMEGAGVAIAAATFHLTYLNVRGICDYGDNEKNDDWQTYASVCAASFARAILEEE